MSQENVELIRLLAERINAGTVEDELELIHPDLELFPPEDEPEARSGVYRGRKGWREYSAFWDESFDQYNVEADEYIDAGEYVVVVGQVRATGRASGAQVESPAVWLWRVRDGMGIEFREYGTKEQALEAAGMRE